MRRRLFMASVWSVSINASVHKEAQKAEKAQPSKTVRRLISILGATCAFLWLLSVGLAFDQDYLEFKMLLTKAEIE